MMKKVLVGLMAIGVVGGLFAAKSVIYAGETKAVQPVETKVETQVQDDEEAVWDAWNTDFAGMLDADEQYAAAEAGVDAYEGDDEKEYGRLEAVRDKRYREIARVVYEKHFGAWHGSDAEFGRLIAAREVNPVAMIEICAKTAIDVCGKGKVKSLRVTFDGGCSLECSLASPTTP